MLRRRKLSLAISALMLTAGIFVVIAALSGVGSKERGRTIPPPRDPGYVAIRPTPIPEATVAPEPSPTPEPSTAPIERLLIPRIGVSAGIQVKGIDKRYIDPRTNSGPMEDPQGPVDVAWYDFSSKPGWGSNAVFAGHVDYAGYGPAVFYKLNQLAQGDEIQVRLEDGTIYYYSVTFSEVFSPDSATQDDINRIVGPTEGDVVTLITCGGTFNTRTREYDRRLIVRAEKVGDSTSARAQ